MEDQAMHGEAEKKEPQSVTEALEELNGVLIAVHSVLELSNLLKERFNRTEGSVNKEKLSDQPQNVGEVRNVVQLINDASSRLYDLQLEIGRNIEYVVRKL